MTHKEFYFWLEGYLHDKKISSYDDAATFLLVIQEKMKEVKDVENSFPRISRTTVPSPFNPVIIPLKNNDDQYKPPFDITC